MGLQHVDTSHQKESVYAETFGHLAPKQNKTYRGELLFSKSYFYSGNNPIIDFEFKGLDSSPWLFSAIEDYIYSSDLPKGSVYKAKITFRNYRIWLTIIDEIKL